MNSYLKPLSILLVLTIFTSCKKEATLSEYKYADKESNVNCQSISPELLKEALYSFEDDVANFYARDGKQNLSQAYSRTINLGIYGNAKYNEMVSPHTLEIFEILKTKTDLWDLSKKNKSLNYKHELVKCLADNISNKDLKTTFNALLSTNSMSAKLIGEPLKRQSSLAIKDKYLATYIALDMYYAKLFDVDFNAPKKEKIEVPKLEIPVDARKKDPHAGHDH